jgi:hypothetical protein
MLAPLLNIFCPKSRIDRPLKNVGHELLGFMLGGVIKFPSFEIMDGKVIFNASSTAGRKHDGGILP